MIILNKGVRLDNANNYLNRLPGLLRQLADRVQGGNYVTRKLYGFTPYVLHSKS